MKIKLPRWLRRDSFALPSWAKLGADRAGVSAVIEADTDGYMAEWLNLLGNPEPDQYWIEVAYQCAKLDLQAALVNTLHDPRVAKQAVEFHFSRSDKWALSKFKKGKGTRAATEGREARGHYVRVRGSMPM